MPKHHWSQEGKQERCFLLFDPFDMWDEMGKSSRPITSHLYCTYAKI